MKLGSSARPLQGRVEIVACQDSTYSKMRLALRLGPLSKSGRGPTDEDRVARSRSANGQSHAHNVTRLSGPAGASVIRGTAEQIDLSRRMRRLYAGARYWVICVGGVGLASRGDAYALWLRG
jgi:hypothetical protein